MCATTAQAALPNTPPFALLGVPFDHVTAPEAIERIERMVASRRPHYLVTANVDFLVQARRDVELRRILLDAHLVLCDGTPVLWASRLLGCPLPERVAGADLVPQLLPVAARKRYRLFFLGATEASAARAVTRLRGEYPDLVLAGHYSPPIAALLEMDHEEMRRRIRAAQPDLLLVSFGCPKQEKWIAMNYRALGVPVAIGVGATIDFLAGQVRRAPRWMRHTGTEWLFRLAQEPRRLFRRYVRDCGVFGWGLLAQWQQLHPVRNASSHTLIQHGGDSGSGEASASLLECSEHLDLPALNREPVLVQGTLSGRSHCLLALGKVRSIDSAGVGFLVRLQKQLRAGGRRLVLVAPSPAVQRALRLMRLEDSLPSAPDLETAQQLLWSAERGPAVTLEAEPPQARVAWHGEISAANAEEVWARTRPHLPAAAFPDTGLLSLGSQASPSRVTLDLSDVPFMDSSGVALLVQAHKQAAHVGALLRLAGVQPPVRNVIRLAGLEGALLAR